MISYQIEQRTKGDELAWITQCYIYKYNPNKNQFELILSFLADINTKGTKWSGRPRIFNIVFINTEGIYYLKKN